MKNILLAFIASFIMTGCIVAAEPVYIPTYENVWVEAHWEYVGGVNVYYPGRHIRRQIPRTYVTPRRRRR